MLSHAQLFVTPWAEPTRFFCPWDFSGKNIGMGCQFILQGIFPIQALNLRLLCLHIADGFFTHWFFNPQIVKSFWVKHSKISNTNLVVTYSLKCLCMWGKRFQTENISNHSENLNARNNLLSYFLACSISFQFFPHVSVYIYLGEFIIHNGICVNTFPALINSFLYFTLEF